MGYTQRDGRKAHKGAKAQGKMRDLIEAMQKVMEMS
jgi:hypothetical protein